MNVVLVGYGRMGKEIEAICRERGHTVVCRVDPLAPEADVRSLEPRTLAGADGVIEFALPADIVKNVGCYATAGVATVVGTTGWSAESPKIQALVEAAGIGFVHGSNFSIGVHMFMQVVGTMAAMLDQQPQFDVMVHEYHHKLKQDSPSGTALSIAARILEQLSRKTTIQTQTLDRAIRDEELHVTSTRGGRIFGTHTVTVDSISDTIELTHTAHNRRGFALGAVLALEWVKSRKGFFQVDDFMAEALGLAGSHTVKP